jgi:hypothetical protein
MGNRHAYIVAILCILLCSTFFIREDNLLQVTDGVRKAYVRRAQIWHERDIPATNIPAGPQKSLSFKPEQLVTCRYIEPHGPSQGFAPKFKCALSESGEEVRIKYGSREVLAEVAGTRLLWTLGFYTDEDYPVKLRCLGCPKKNPFHPEKNDPRIERVFDDAILEPNFPGKEIGEYHDQGWKWQELDQVDDARAARAHIDALKLLAVFIQHTDSKRQQQRLGCYDEDIEGEGKTEWCKKPVLMIQDLGITFGKGGPEIEDLSSMTLASWKSVDIWNRQKEIEYAAQHQGRQVCIGNLTSADFAKGEGLFDPQISEAGRAFLADLLNELSDQQIYDLFRVARADLTKDVIQKNGASRVITIADWVEEFKNKRDQITNRRCP